MLDSYPSLTAAEFAEGCSGFEARCHDRLSGTDWLSVKWTGRELRIGAQTRVASRHADADEEDIHDEEEDNHEIEEIEMESDGVDDEEEEAVCECLNHLVLN